MLTQLCVKRFKKNFFSEFRSSNLNSKKNEESSTERERESREKLNILTYEISIQISSHIFDLYYYYYFVNIY